jgi:glycogen synthase
VFVVHALIADRLAQGPSPYNPPTTLLYTRSNRHALRHADRVVCVSRYMAEVAAREGAPRERLRVLSNTVSLDRFSPAEDAKTIDVLFVGRLSSEKGVDTLLRAAPGLPGRRIVIVGDGPAAAELRALAARTGAGASFVGSRGPAEVAALMRQARLLVVPSRSEPQGVVVLEALAAGLPVVGSAVGGIPELIEPGATGWLVAPDDPDALGDAIAAALDEPRRLSEMGARARESALAYGPDALARGFADAYL